MAVGRDFGSPFVSIYALALFRSELTCKGDLLLSVLSTRFLIGRHDYLFA